ncbi:MAG: apolipoprotein N-acyltransferase [Candidatus Bruticola sp.]
MPSLHKTEENERPIKNLRDSDVKITSEMADDSICQTREGVETSKCCELMQLCCDSSSVRGYKGPLILGTFSALLICLCFPFMRLWPLIFVALVPFFWAAARIKNVKQALCLGFSFGFVLHLVSMSWLSVFGWAAPPALAVEKGIIPGFVAAAIFWLRHKQKNFGLYAVGAASLYIIGEYLQTVGIFGVNWAFLSAALARVPLLLQANSLWGMWGLSFAVALVNVGLAELLIRKYRFKELSSNESATSEKNITCKNSLKGWAWSCGLLWGGIVVFGVWQLSLAPSPEQASEQPGAVKWGIIQLSIPQKKKFDPFFAEKNFDLLKKASFQAIEQGAEVIGWPETSVPYLHFLSSREKRRSLKKMIQEYPAWYVVGSIESAPENGTYNTMSIWSDRGTFQDRYEKWNIVPFGEYLPYRKYWPEWIPGVKLVMNYKPGRGSCAFKVKDSKVGILICFESMCTWVARQHVLKGAEILFAPTNDAWFKETAELPGHFDMSILRAVELSRPVIPVGNTGISGFIDQYGRVLQESKINEEAIMVGCVVPNSKLTLYAIIGDWVICLYILLLAGCLIFSPKSRGVD